MQELSNDKVLAKLYKLYGRLSWPKKQPSAFNCLVHSVIAQQISAVSAASVWEKLKRTALITPEQLLALDTAAWRTCGIPSFRVSYIRNLCEFFIQNGITEIENSNSTELIKKLLSVRGIGPWTIDMLQIFHLNNPDIFPLGDIALQRIIYKHYNQSQVMEKDIFTKLTNSWRPYRSIACLYLWRSFDDKWVEF